MEYISECKTDVKFTWISHMALNGSCFMVTWITFKNHLLDVSLTQNQETMALRTLTTVDLFYLIMCEDPCEEKLLEMAFGWGSVTTLHDFEGVSGRPLDTFLWALTISWSRLVALVCDVALSFKILRGWRRDMLAFVAFLVHYWKGNLEPWV